jgi:hypothetical protein
MTAAALGRPKPGRALSEGRTTVTLDGEQT